MLRLYYVKNPDSGPILAREWQSTYRSGAGWEFRSGETDYRLLLGLWEALGQDRPGRFAPARRWPA